MEWKARAQLLTSVYPVTTHPSLSWGRGTSSRGDQAASICFNLQGKKDSTFSVLASCTPTHTDSISGSAQTGARPRYNPPAPPGATPEHCNLRAILGEHPQNKQTKRKSWQQNNSGQICLTQFSLLFWKFVAVSRFCSWPPFTCSIWDLWWSTESWDLQALPSCLSCWLCSHDGSCNEIGHQPFSRNSKKVTCVLAKFLVALKCDHPPSTPVKHNSNKILYFLEVKLAFIWRFWGRRRG